MASFFATDFLGTAPSTSATGQNGSVIAQLVKIAINMHFCDFSMIAYLSDPSGADLTLGLVFFLLQLWFSSSPVHTKRHSGLPYCRGGQRSEMW